jgi:hypothetical protein
MWIPDAWWPGFRNDPGRHSDIYLFWCEAFSEISYRAAQSRRGGHYPPCLRHSDHHDASDCLVESSSCSCGSWRSRSRRCKNRGASSSGCSSESRSNQATNSQMVRRFVQCRSHRASFGQCAEVATHADSLGGTKATVLSPATRRL